ncbi:hypothetical protein HPB50_027800 [Hyalomma asiaticum]|nr:hypothetical protein HPB50_027800 [Hyalomma asiaticum]
MPSNAEVAKRVESLEKNFENKLEDLMKDLMGRLLEGIRKHSTAEQGSLCDTVEFLSKEYDAMRLKQDELLAANKALAAENDSLRITVANREQYSRINNIEIKGVPSTQGEDCAAILKQVGQAIDCPVSPDDIDCVHRVATKSAARGFPPINDNAPNPEKAREHSSPKAVASTSGLHVLKPRGTPVVKRALSYWDGERADESDATGTAPALAACREDTRESEGDTPSVSTDSENTGSSESETSSAQSSPNTSPAPHSIVVKNRRTPHLQ